MENIETSKIVKFEVNNMMAIRFAEVEFDENGGLVMLGGANGSGKSSLIQALQFAFGGKKAVDKDPLRYGAEKGFVKVTLGGREFQIRRSINDKGNETLTVKGADGKNITSPQSVLNDLMGSVGIDPSIIWNMSDEKISTKLRDAMGIDLTPFEKREEDIANERKLAKKKLKNLVSEFEGCETFDDVPSEKVSASSLLEEFGQAVEHNKNIQRVTDEMKSNIEKVSDIDSEIESLKERIESLSKEGEVLQRSIEQAGSFLNVSKSVDVEEIRMRMVDVEKTNEKIEKNNCYASIKSSIEKQEMVVNELESSIDIVRKEKKNLIASAEFPLEGVDFDINGKLILDGKPWRAWSDGERLLAAFEISAAMSPNLKAVVMRQGAWFDEESRKVVANIAKERGYLVLMEIVGDSDEVSILMEDGQVKDKR